MYLEKVFIERIDFLANFCTHCGSPISEGDSFCGNCGAKLNSPEILNNVPETVENNSIPSPEQNFVPPAEPVTKKKKKKGGCLKALLIVAVIIILLLVGFIALILIGNEETPVASPSESFSSSFIESPAEEIAPEAAYEGDYSKEEIDELIETLNMVLESTSPESIVYHNIEYLDGILYYNYAIDGIAEAVYNAKDFGFDETFSSWVEYRNSTINLYNSVDEVLSTFGYSDLPLALMVLNDEDYDIVFLTIYEGYVVYDVMAD